MHASATLAAGRGREVGACSFFFFFLWRVCVCVCVLFVHYRRVASSTSFGNSASDGPAASWRTPTEKEHNTQAGGPRVRRSEHRETGESRPKARAGVWGLELYTAHSLGRKRTRTAKPIAAACPFWRVQFHRTLPHSPNESWRFNPLCHPLPRGPCPRGPAHTHTHLLPRGRSGPACRARRRRKIPRPCTTPRRAAGKRRAPPAAK